MKSIFWQMFSSFTCKLWFMSGIACSILNYVVQIVSITYNVNSVCVCFCRKYVIHTFCSDLMWSHGLDYGRCRQTWHVYAMEIFDAVFLRQFYLLVVVSTQFKSLFQLNNLLIMFKLSHWFNELNVLLHYYKYWHFDINRAILLCHSILKVKWVKLFYHLILFFSVKVTVAAHSKDTETNCVKYCRIINSK